MQIEAFAGDVRTQEDAQRVVQATEAVDQLLLLRVGHLAVQHLNLVGLELEVGGEVLAQPAQGFDALGKDDQAVFGVLDLPAELG